MKLFTLEASILVLCCNHLGVADGNTTTSIDQGNSKNFHSSTTESLFKSTTSFIARDHAKHGRRYFPDYGADSKHSRVSYPPHPSCRNKTCTLNIPQSLSNTTDPEKTFLEPTAFSAGFSKNGLIEIEPPNGEPYDSSVAIGDINGDGYPDSVVVALMLTDGSWSFHAYIYFNTRHPRRPFGDPEPLFTATSWRNHYSIVKLADLNNDERLDILFAGVSGIVVLMNRMENGDVYPQFDRVDPSTFRHFEVGAMEIADVNNDGCLDLVISDESGDICRYDYDDVAVVGCVRPNQDYGWRYGHPQNFIAVNSCQSEMLFQNFIALPNKPNHPAHFQMDCKVGIADVDNDGWPDILISSIVNRDGTGSGRDDPQTFLWMNYDGHFDYSPEESLDNYILTLPGGEYTSFCFGDFNGDNYVDLIGRDFDGQEFLLTNNNGRFIESDRVLLPGDGANINTAPIAAGDVNGDGLLDIIRFSTTEVSSILNMGDGRFTDPISLTSATMSSSTGLLADVNNDGILDIVTPNSVSINSVDFAIGDRISLPGGRAQTFQLIIEDFDLDGFDDIFVANEGGPYQILFNTGGMLTSEDNSIINLSDIKDEKIGNWEVYEPTPPITSFAVADLNNDTYPDIVAITRSGNQILFNNGEDRSFRSVEIPACKAEEVALGDINDDGVIDIVIGCWRSCDEGGMPLEIVFGGNSSDYVTSEHQSNRYLSQYIPACYSKILLIDVDGNDRLDIVIIRDKVLHVYAQSNDDSSYHEIYNYREIYNHAVPGPRTSHGMMHLVHLDVDLDGAADILCGYGGTIELFVNDGHGNFTKDDNFVLNGVKDIEVMDLDDDGYDDIIVARQSEVEVLINLGNRSFVSTMRETALGANVISVADINRDGKMDIVVGTNVENSLFLFNPCATGAQITSQSWCFKCPDYMGKRDSPYYIGCVECLRDHMQQPGLGEKCDTFPCPFGKRDFGENECKSCPHGTFYDSLLSRIDSNESSWEFERCVNCAVGTFADSAMRAIDSCFPCRPGQYQDQPGQRSCKPCANGTYQIEFGNSTCEACKPGGYCTRASLSDGGYKPCPPGTYNDELRKSDEKDCKPCPSGTYSFESGLISSSLCLDCAAGSYQDKEGQTACKLCDKGFYQTETRKDSCMKCEEGFYAAFNGTIECNECPFPLHSPVSGSHKCSVCMEGYYMVDEDYIGSDMLFQNPRTLCAVCPENMTECLPNTSLQNITVLPGYWRDSFQTSRVYKCKYTDLCAGSPSKRGRFLVSSDRRGYYCADNHTGALCEACVKPDQYFNEADGRCTNCNSSALYIHLAVFLAVPIILVLLCCSLRDRFGIFSSVLLGWSLQAKLKILVGFYQVISSFRVVYGVSVDDRLSGLFDICSILSLDFLEILSFPLECFGEKTTSYVLSAIWPYMLCALIICFLWVLKVVTKDVTNDRLRTSIEGIVRIKPLQVFVVIFYVALPMVSKSIFDVKTCQAFKTSDGAVGIVGDDTYNSYLVSSMKIRCDAGVDEVYAKLQMLFWVFFVLWPCLTLAMLSGLIAKITPSVQRQRPSSLAVKCRFLWSDFDDSSQMALYWDIVDFFRKVFLTGFINFIDVAEGSNKMLRLTVAASISTLYFALLVYVRPYKRKDDYQLSILSSLLLVLCFGLGSILQICENKVNAEACVKYVGFGINNSFGASVLVTALAMTMIIVTFLVFVGQTYKSPVARLKSTGYPPCLELPTSCEHHIFMSHVWKTGQDKCHSIARKLQLFMPGLKLWLDVDNLSSLSDLEKFVEKSALMLIFYSEGYFHSRNCRREFFHALTLNKPLVVIFDGDDVTIQKMKNECISYCNDDSIKQFCSENSSEQLSTEISSAIQRFLVECDEGDTFIQWLKVGSFSSESLKLIYLRLLEILPRYQEPAYKSLLMKGLLLPDDAPLPSLPFDVTTIVSEVNDGAIELARELKAMTDGKIHVCEIQKDFYETSQHNGATQNIISEKDPERNHQSPSLKISANGNSSIYDPEIILDPITDGCDSIDDTANRALSTNDNASLSISLLPNHDNHYSQAGVDSTKLSSIEHGFGGDVQISSKPYLPCHNKVLLLYLNKETFNNENKETMTNVIQTAQEQKVPIIVVHEQDTSKDAACDFGYFFKHTPFALISSELYSDIAVPLYTRREYRRISLNMILQTIMNKVKEQGID